MQALQGATSKSVTNSDGSTTTSLTYADGSKVTMTSAGIGQFVERRDLVLQFHRADDPAPGQGDLVFGQPIALGQRLSKRRDASERALPFCLSMIFSENRFPLFRIML